MRVTEKDLIQSRLEFYDTVTMKEKAHLQIIPKSFNSSLHITNFIHKI